MKRKHRIRFVVQITAGIVLGWQASLPTALASTNTPHFFIYQGRLLNAQGDAPLTSTVDIQLSIYSPAGNCLLYEEQQTGIDLSQSNGLFSLQVGSTVGASKRTASDPGKSMSQVFSNSSTHAAGANCASGYSPVAGDSRKLRVTVTPSGGTPVVLSPDQTIGGVPASLVADTLQGKDASQFVQISGNLSQVTAENLVGGGDASSLHHHDSLYLKASSSSSQNFGSGGFVTSGVASIGSLSAPTSTQFQVTSGGTGTKGLVVVGAVSQAANLIEVQNSSNTSIFSVDASGNVSSAGSMSTKYLHLGPLTSGEEAALTSTLSSSDKGKIWYSVTDDQFKYYDGSIRNFSSGGGGSLASLNGLTSGSQSFAIGTSGNSPSFSSSSSTHTLNIPMASTTGVTAGLISKSDYDTFAGKQNALGYTPVNKAGDSITGGLSVNPSTDVVGLTVQGKASGTSDLLQLKNGSGSLVTKVDKDGYLTLPGAPSGTAQAATKAYVDSAISSIDNSAYLRKDGTGTATANQNLGGFKLTNVGTATASMDAANKGYVDSAITSALTAKQDSLGFTPVNKAGDSMTGSLALGTGTTLRLGRYDNSEETTLTSSLTAGDVGKTWFNSQSNQVKYWDGSAAQALGVSGAGLTSLNGQSGGTQIFAVSTSGTGAPYYDSASNTHTLTFPMASSTGVTAGLLSKSDYDAFSSKISAISGDGSATLSGGTATITLSAGSVTGKALTGFASGTGSISASDTLLSAIGKLDGNLALKENAIGTGSTSQFFRGDKTWQSLSTSDVSEGTNLYYTDARARAALSGSNGIAVDSSTGAISLGTGSSATLNALTLNSLGSGVVRSNSSGVLSSSALSASDITSALTFTPINKAGDSLTGSLALGTGTTLKLGQYTNAEETTLTSGLTAGDVGKAWYNSSSNQIKYWNGSAVSILGLSTSGLTSLNGLSGQSQTLAINASGTAASPEVISSGTTHTISLPMASSTGVTGGLLSKTDYDAFTAKQAAGNYITALTGDGTLSGFSNGTATLTLSAGSVTGKTLTGFSSGTGTIHSTDTILSAFNKLNGNMGLRLLKSGDTMTGTLNINLGSDSNALSIRANGTQTSDLFVIADSSGNTLSKFDYSGMLTLAGEPTGTAHAATKSYVDTQVQMLGMSSYVKRDGSTNIYGDQSMTGFKITSLGTPTSNMDAANKGYVDSNLAGIPIAVSSPSPGQILVWSGTQWENMTQAASGTGGGVSSVSASGVLSSTGGTDPVISFTGIIPISQGGTGTNTQNFVDLSTSQTIGGNKTFSGNLATSGTMTVTGNLATSANVTATGNVSAGGNVDATGNLTAGGNLVVTGSGTFSGSGVFTGPVTAAEPTATSHLTTRNYVDSIAAAKQDALGFTPLSNAGGTLYGPLVLSGNPTANLQAAPKQYVDSQVSTVSTSLTTLNGSTIKKDGTVAFTAAPSIGGNRILDVAAPTSGTDAANKDYVDSHFAGGAVAVSSLSAGQTLVWSGTQWENVTPAPSGTGSGGALNSVSASGVLSSSGGTDPVISLTGVVPISLGGTGTNTQNFVDLTTTQTVAGNKTFSGNMAVGGTLSVTGTVSAATPTAGTHVATKQYVDDAVAEQEDGEHGVPKLSNGTVFHYLSTQITADNLHEDNCDSGTEAYFDYSQDNSAIGRCFEKSPRTADTWLNAKQTCENAGKRLPEPHEWMILCSNATALSIDRGGMGTEWTNNARMQMDDFYFYGIGVVSGTTGCAQATFQERTTSTPKVKRFRCVK